MTEHTPGPWVYREDDQTITAILEGEVARKYDAQAIIAEVRPQPEAYANARLIAAAPETAAERDRLREVNAELLEALRNLVVDLEERAEWDGEARVVCAGAFTYSNARAAIAKAATDDA
jgi:hypothetical protein